MTWCLYFCWILDIVVWLLIAWLFIGIYILGVFVLLFDRIELLNLCVVILVISSKVWESKFLLYSYYASFYGKTESSSGSRFFVVLENGSSDGVCEVHEPVKKKYKKNPKSVSSTRQPHPNKKGTTSRPQAWVVCPKFLHLMLHCGMFVQMICLLSSLVHRIG